VHIAETRTDFADASFSAESRRDNPGAAGIINDLYMLTVYGKTEIPVWRFPEPQYRENTDALGNWKDLQKDFRKQ